MSEKVKELTLKENVLNFLRNCFSKKNTLWKVIWFSIAIAIVIIPAIPLNVIAYKQGEQVTHGHNNFIIWTVTFNLGNGFGSGSEWPQGAVYFLKIFMSLIILCLGLFLPCKWYYTLPLFASFIGGMFNVFDKAAHNNWVVDYFEMFPKNGQPGTGWFIFNVPDFYITGGIFFTCGAFIVVFIIQMVNEKKKSKDAKPN